jgi:hypothetical protein
MELQGAVDFKSFYCVVSLALGLYVVLLKFAVFSSVILVQIQDNYHLRRQRSERSSHIRSDCSVALFGPLFVLLSAVVLCQKECIVLRASRELSHSQFIVNSWTIHRQVRGASCCRCRVTQHHTASHGQSGECTRYWNVLFCGQVILLHLNSFTSREWKSE